MLYLKQSTIVTFQFGPFVDQGDGVAPETGLATNMDNATTGIRVSKNGATMIDRNSITAPAHDDDGYYRIELSVTDTDTLGTLFVQYEESGVCLPMWREFMVVTANYWDSLFGTDVLNASVTQWDGTALGAIQQAGFPTVTIKDGTGTGEIDTAAGAIANVTLVATTTAVTNQVTADATQIGGQTASAAGTVTFPGTIASATNITAATVTLADGAHGGTAAVLTLERAIVASTTATEPAIKLTGNTTGAGLNVIGGLTGAGLLAIGGGTSGDGILAFANGSGSGLDLLGVGTEAGLTILGGATGAGIKVTGGEDGIGLEIAGGGTSGDGIDVSVTSGIEIDANITGNLTGNVTGSVDSVSGHTNQTGDTFALANGAAGFVAIDTVVDAVKVKTDFLPSVIAGGTGGVFIAGTNAATVVTTSFTTTFTGNLTGSVDSVTNAVGSVAGNVDGNVTGSVASNLELGPSEVLTQVNSVCRATVNAYVSSNVCFVGQLRHVVGTIERKHNPLLARHVFFVKTPLL